MVWHFCQAQDAEKLELLNKRISRFIFKDWNRDYDKRGLVSKETVVLRRWGSETRKFGLSTELTM